MGERLINILKHTVHKLHVLISQSSRKKRYKILKISNISKLPGKTSFLVLFTERNISAELTAEKIIKNGYRLCDFNTYDANLIYHASIGKVFEFLNIEEQWPDNSISAKSFDKELDEYLFTITHTDGFSVIKTANEILKDKALLGSLSFADIYDVAYTQDSETMIKEKINLRLTKNQSLSAKRLSKTEECA